MRRKVVVKESKSLKTFYIYIVLVLLAIGVSFVIKLIFIIQQSKFDGRQHFTVVVTKEQKVKEIIAFNPKVSSMAVLTVKDANVSVSSIVKDYGIASDAQLEVNDAVSLGQDVTLTLWDSVAHFTSIKTDLTVVDLLRLTVLSKDITTNNKIVRDISLSQKNSENNTIIARALNDPMLASENISIQIINAADTTGVGQRLSRVLTNMGANVVEVSTSLTPQPKSKIEYFGETSYTLDHLKSFLDFPTSELTRQPIANIVIILGEDSRNTSKF